MSLPSLFSLFSREKPILCLVLVRAGPVYRGGNNTEPLDSLSCPGREREYSEERSLIRCINDAKEYEGNDTSDGRVFLLEAGEDSRENANEVIHLAFVFISV
jgi:hypothetical protein